MVIKKTILCAAIAMSLFGCGGESTPETSVKSEAMIIDVRSPEEFAEGHLEGAVNLDLEGGVFEAEFSKLDPSLSYVVYCRSGRRSAIAYSILKDNGFAEVSDLQTLENAANKTGLSIVSN